MTEATIAAFADHGKVVANSIEADVEEAQRLLQQDLPQVGIALEQVIWQFQNDGIQKFIDPFDALMLTLADKTHDPQEFLGDPMHSAR